MTEVKTIERQQAITDYRGLATAALIGVVAGALTWAIGWLIAQFIVEPIFCGAADTSAICDGRETTAYNISLVLVSFGALLALVWARVFRPLLVVLASALVAWGMIGFFDGSSWWLAPVWISLLSGLSYGLFAWIANLRSFGLAMGITVVVVVGLRLISTL